MTDQPQQAQPKAAADVPGQVFDQFLKKLAESKTPTPVIERLRVLLQSEKAFSEKAVAEALFTEEQLP